MPKAVTMPNSGMVDNTKTQRRLNLGMSRIAFYARITSLVSIISFFKDS
jgi:hypothetical protein